MLDIMLFWAGKNIDGFRCDMAELEKAKAEAYRLGADKGIDPFMTLSFLSLPVIPVSSTHLDVYKRTNGCYGSA